MVPVTKEQTSKKECSKHLPAVDGCEIHPIRTTQEALEWSDSDSL